MLFGQACEVSAMNVDAELAERFVRENWSLLAAAAWRFHLAHGRGAVIVEWTLVEHWSTDRSLLFATSYTTRTDHAGFNAVIAKYEPTTAIVIVFADGPLRRGAGSGSGLAAITVSAQPPPPAAHRAFGH